MIFAHKQLPAIMFVLPLLSGGQAMRQSGPPSRSATQRYEPAHNVTQYFPNDVFGYHWSIVRIFSKYLEAMGEKLLFKTGTSEIPETVRLLVALRPNNSPLLVRLEIKPNESGEITVKVGRDGRHPGLLTMQRSSAIATPDVTQFLYLLSNSGFWTLPTTETIDLNKPVVQGDASWILEASIEGKYHVVYRGQSEAGSLRIPYDFLVTKLAAIDPKSLPVGQEGPTAKR
jgi:hypothetical protein